MTKNSSNIFILFILLSSVLSGCATKPISDSPITIVKQNASERAAKLLKINQWRLHGKIAFIEQFEDGKSKRQSATISWRVNEKNQTQELNLTSYLGINVLHLTSNNNNHLIEVDGKEYRANNLAELIHSLTGLTLPTKALNFWLKGLSYQPTDKITLSTETQLPINLTSTFNHVKWDINYSKYKVFDGAQMATQFTIKKNGLLIKIAVKEWSLLD